MAERLFIGVKRAVNQTSEWIRPGKDPIGDNLQAYIAEQDVIKAQSLPGYLNMVSADSDAYVEADRGQMLAEIETELWADTYNSYLRRINGDQRTPNSHTTINFDLRVPTDIIRQRLVDKRRGRPVVRSQKLRFISFNAENAS